MKYAVGVRVEGRSGEFLGVSGVISSRLKVGSQNLLLIRWSDHRESRVPTGAVRVLADEGPNQVPDRVNQNVLARQVNSEDGDGSEDDMSQQSEDSEEGSEQDMGDQDGYL